MASLSTWGNTLIGQDDYVNHAANRARAQYDAGINSAIRQAGRMGINPSSGAFMNMMNQAQYERTAGINAAANEADNQWLNAAQKQFNADRDFSLSQQRVNNANNQWWAQFGFLRNRIMAEYAREQEKYKQANKNGTAGQQAGQQNQQAEQQNQQAGSSMSKWGWGSLSDSPNYKQFDANAKIWNNQNKINKTNYLRSLSVSRNPYRWQYGDGVDVSKYLDEQPGYWHPFNKSWRGGM